jgi:hypothetical protein
MLQSVTSRLGPAAARVASRRSMHTKQATVFTAILTISCHSVTASGDNREMWEAFVSPTPQLQELTVGDDRF